VLVERLRARGVDQPWEHQALAAQLAWSGVPVLLSTGTASGKSLAYQIPVLSSLLSDDPSTALYVTPTKALATDQLRSILDLELPSVRAATYDGDTGVEERRWVRTHAQLVLTNPDMLHRGILPRHTQWRSFLRRLRYVVVDECHVYRGVFGSHVAHVLRRLRRICARYGAAPVFVLASATVAQPAELGARLTGLDMRSISDDASPRGGVTFALWEPPLTQLEGENGAPVRRSATSETARLLADLVVEGARTLVFTRSRVGAEVVALTARRILEESAPELAPRVAA
jgi:DEAD/DEAH box helicase domain-containing protein